MVRPVLTCLVCVALLASLVGCGGKSQPANRPATAKVKATVIYKGQPVEGANVVFSPSDAAGKPAAGRTGADGVAKLTTFEPEDGAVPGNYKVAITKTDAPTAAPASAGGSAPSGDAYTQALAKAGGPKATVAQPKDLLPEKYKSAETSTLTATVKGGTENSFQFELTD
jgi:predicted small lipoprotein YifL